MTAKRHSKLLRAFVTRVNEHAKATNQPTASNLYDCVRLAEKGLTPKGCTRAEWWKKIEDTFEYFNFKAKI